MWGENVLTFKFSKFNKHDKECLIYKGLIIKATAELCASAALNKSTKKG